MKNNCRKLFAALALALALSPSTFAEGISSEVSPPPQTTAGIIHTEKNGIIHTEKSGIIQTGTPASGIMWPNTLTEIGLSLLQSLTRI